MKAEKPNIIRRVACNAAGGIVARLILERPFDHAAIYVDDGRVRNYVHVPQSARRSETSIHGRSNGLSTEEIRHDAEDEMIAYLAQYAAEDILFPRKDGRPWHWQRKSSTIPNAVAVDPRVFEFSNQADVLLALEKARCNTYFQAFNQAWRFIKRQASPLEAFATVDAMYPKAVGFLMEGQCLSLVSSVADMLSTDLDVSGGSGIKRVISCEQAQRLLSAA